jgi:hypothetical protein
MTIADFNPSSSRQKRSWRARLRSSTDPLNRSSALLPPSQSPLSTTRRHKPSSDMADWLLMSTADTKAPVETAGSDELMDALVRDESVVPRAEVVAPEQEPTAPAAEPFGAESSISSEARVDLLQREIETLLRDTPEIAPTDLATLPQPALAEPPLHPVAEELQQEEMLRHGAMEPEPATAEMPTADPVIGLKQHVRRRRFRRRSWTPFCRTRRKWHRKRARRWVMARRRRRKCRRLPGLTRRL